MPEQAFYYWYLFMKTKQVLEEIKNVSNTLRWKDIESLCNEKEYKISQSKKGYKVYIGRSVWSVHIEHRTSDKLKFGIIRELRKILIKENIIKNDKKNTSITNN